MTAQEIRALSVANDDSVILLREIAAQIAEYNESCIPRMVEFTFKGRAFSVNVRDVSTVGSTSEAGHTYVGVYGRPFTCDQSYEEVLKRLGIEVAHA